jgi:preprotein translocase subunit SecG
VVCAVFTDELAYILSKVQTFKHTLARATGTVATILFVCSIGKKKVVSVQKKSQKEFIIFFTY